jgi:hypothetical protein
VDETIFLNTDAVTGRFSARRITYKLGFPQGRQFPQQSVDHLLIVQIAQADAE